MIRSAICVALCTLGISLPALSAGTEDFSELGTLLKQMSANPKAEAFLRIGKDRIDIVQMRERTISEEDFKRAAATRPDESMPRLRFSGDLEGIELSLEGDATVIQYSKHGEPRPSSWVRRDPVTMSSFPRKDWRRFLEAALQQGLSQYSVAGEDSGMAVLHFRGPSPSVVDSPFGHVTFPPSFYESMQRSARFPEKAGTAGFVILVHEPHGDFVGQKAMLKGLRTLQAANPSRPFEFLVEGTYERDDRRILFNGLDHELDAASGGDQRQAEQFVLALLEPHIVDGPMAYRLLNDRTMSAWAIDDNFALAQDVGGSEGTDPQKVVSAIVGLGKAAHALPPAERDELDLALESVLAYMTADVSDVDGAQLVAYYESVANLLGVLAKVAPGLPGATPRALAALRAQAIAYSVEHQQYGAALRRDATLGQQIVERCKGDGVRSKLPLAFIGNFHTDGVTRQLQKANIGYVVIEPRVHGFETAKQEEAFQRMIHPATRRAAIRKVLGLNTGQVAPSGKEVNGPIHQFFSRRVKQPGREPAVASTPGLDVSRLRESLRSNTMLSGATLDLGGGGAPPIPPQFKGAFAFFDPGEDGRSPRFVLLDERGGRGRGGGTGDGFTLAGDGAGSAGGGSWNGGERYEFLKHAIIVPAAREEKTEERMAAVFFQDPTSGKMFAVVHDHTSGRFYMMDTSNALDVLGTLGPPAPKKGKDAKVHIRLSELWPRESHTERNDA